MDSKEKETYPIPPSLLESAFFMGLKLSEWLVVGLLMAAGTIVVAVRKDFYEALALVALPVGAYFLFRRWPVRGAYVNAAHGLFVQLRYYSGQQMFVLRRALKMRPGKELLELVEDKNERQEAVSGTSEAGESQRENDA